MSNNKLFAPLRFTFLNLSHEFKGTINWNFDGHGKLWNYNLQYFDFLHDPSIDHITKQHLVDDFSNQLLSGHIKPEPYPVSLRIINWFLFYGDTGYASKVFTDALKYQVHYLECNLEYHILANHYLENLLSLSVASIGLQDGVLSRKIFPKLRAQLKEQLFKDGGHYERSPMYHCIVLSRLLLLYELSINNPGKFSNFQELKPDIEAMCGWLSAFTYTNGTYELVNDSIKNIAPNPNELLKVATSLGINKKQVKLADSGFRKFKSNHYEALVDVGNISPSYQPGHTHAGMLAFNIQYHGSPFIVDMGTSTYNASERRHFERSTSAHNTVVVNQKNQFQIWSSFRVGARAKISIIKETEKTISASHNGYNQYGIVHQRDFSFHDHIEVKDYLIGKDCTSTLYIYFDNTIRNVSLNFNEISISEKIKIRFDDPLNVLIEQYQQSIGFNKFEEAFLVKVLFKKTISTQISFP